jgi:O-methyltransferase
MEAARSPKQRDFTRLDQYLKALARSTAVRWLQRSNLMLVKKRTFDPTERANGIDWPFFGYTMIGHKRLDNLQDCIMDVLDRQVPGDFVETGVWRGGATIFMRAALKARGETDRTVWVADSFAGLPKPRDSEDGEDLSHVEHLAVSLDRVRDNFARFDLLDGQVKFLKGWFCDTLPTAPIEKLALLRLDGDLYSSTMDALQALYPKVSPGGYVIVDDYGSWPECKRAVDEYIARNQIRADIHTVDYTGAYWRVER